MTAIQGQIFLVRSCELHTYEVFNVGCYRYAYYATIMIVLSHRPMNLWTFRPYPNQVLPVSGVGILEHVHAAKFCYLVPWYFSVDVELLVL